MAEVPVESGGGSGGLSIGGFSLDDMVRRAVTPPDVDVEGIKSKVGDIAKRETETTDRVRGAVFQDIEQDRKKIHSAYEGIEPADVKPWNAKEEKEKNSTDPIMAFGSLGSVFAIMASAFTRQPMINALNGSAAAMTAIKERDDKAYDQAFTAWKENTTLAIKRHEMQREAYADAMKLLQTDMTAGQAQLTMLAAKFGDEKTKAFIEGGYIKELYELQQAQQQNAMKMVALLPQIEALDTKHRMLQLDPDYSGPNATPQSKLAALRRMTEGRLSPEQDAYEAGLRQHKEENNGEEMPADERSELIQKIRRFKQLSPEQQVLERLAETEPNASPERMAEVLRAAKAARGGGAGSPDAQRRDEVYRAKIKEWQDKHPGEEPPADVKKAANDAAYGRGGVTGNKKIELEKMVTRYNHNLETIGKAIDILWRETLVAGIGGQAGRLMERVDNIVRGMDKNDRVQFSRFINELKLEGPQLLTDRAGKPLAAQQKLVDQIIGGLERGDTTANTLRSLKEIMETYRKLRQSNLDILSGTWTPDSGTVAGQGPAAAPSAAGDNPKGGTKFLSAPPVE